MAPTVQPDTIQRDTATMVPHLKKLAPDAQTREYIYKSKLPPIDIDSNVPLATYVLERARSSREQAGRTCIIAHGGRRYTYGDVAELTRRLAAGLATAGVGRGDVVMLLLPNCAEFMLAFLGIVHRGAVATTANPFYTAREVAKQAAASRATMVITSKAYLPKLADLGPNQVTVVLVDADDNAGDSPVTRFQDLFLDGDELEAAEAMLQGEPPVDPDDVAALPYSSGTTGLPKGVMLTHRSLVTSVAQQVDGDNPNIYWTPDDVVLCVLPLFHIYSLNSVFLCSLRVGATVVIMPKFDIVNMLGLIQEHRITIAPFVPPIVLALAKNPVVDNYDLSSVRMAISGAAPLGKDLEDSFRARLPRAILGQGYGMTEAGPVLAMNLAFAREPFPVKPGSCGTIVRNAEAKVVDPETGVSLPHNHSGEICIRGAQIMKGYLNDPDSTALTVDKEGWLHTGDVGYIDDDEEVFLVDRVKEIIKYKGFQVAPAEIEAILVSHKAVADAAVISKQDETAGELPVAFVVLSNGSQISEDELKQFVAQQVVFYKKLYKIYFVDSIPKSPSGKIIRKDLRNRPELLL